MSSLRERASPLAMRGDPRRRTGQGETKRASGLEHPSAISKSVIASPATVRATSCNIRSMRSPSPYLVAAWGRLESSPSSAMHPPAGSSQQPVPGAPVGVGAPKRCNCYLERQRPAPTGMIARCVVAVVGREQSKPGPEGGGERSGAEQVGGVVMVQKQREDAV